MSIIQTEYNFVSVMNLTDRAQHIFNQLDQHCTTTMQMTDVDVYLLEVLSDALAKYSECVEVLSKQGMTQTAKNGFEVARPEVAIAQQLMGTIIKLGDRIGITPMSRKKLLGIKTIQKDPKPKGFNLN
jgi:P27 family predicted phage terminase small subunit